MSDDFAERIATALTDAWVNASSFSTCRSCRTIAIGHTFAPGFAARSFRVANAALGTETAERPGRVLADGGRMAGTWCCTFVDVNALAIDCSVSRLAITDGLVVLRSASSFAARNSLAGI